MAPAHNTEPQLVWLQRDVDAFLVKTPVAADALCPPRQICISVWPPLGNILLHQVPGAHSNNRTNTAPPRPVTVLPVTFLILVSKIRSSGNCGTCGTRICLGRLVIVGHLCTLDIRIYKEMVKISVCLGSVGFTVLPKSKNESTSHHPMIPQK